MSGIRTVNRVWERKIRGVYPVARYALGDEGELLLAVPRPLEARSYDLTCFHADGRVETGDDFTVETLQKLELTAGTGCFLGLTGADVYLFRGGSKMRFLGDRRILSVDASLSADGQRLVAAFSDMAGASFTLAHGDIVGHVAWTRDVDAPLSTVAISRDGQRIVVGAETGMLWLTDAARRDLWAFDQPEPLRALACSSDGLAVAYGTANGDVGWIDGDGVRRWEAHLAGEITALALSGDGTLCVALTRTPDDPTSAMIYCLTGAGEVSWEYDAEKRLIGLSVAENGRYLATGARDGSVALYEVVPGAATWNGGIGDLLRTEVAQESEPDIARLRALRAALDERPCDMPLFHAWVSVGDRWRRARMDEARGEADADAALQTLQALLDEYPEDPEALNLRTQIRETQSRRLLTEARSLAANGDIDGAESRLLEAIRSAPLLREAREELAGLRAHHADEADREAERLTQEGDMDAAVEALEKAQAVAPSAERAERIQAALTAQGFADGMTAYNAKRYREAIFRFKKVLARDPNHAEAQRYLNYAQRFAQDSTTDTLSDRFSRLE